MTILVTGSAGHLGEALMRTLQHAGQPAVGLDIKASEYTRHVGSIADRAFVARCMAGVEAVIHTATLHKPHIATHSNQDFIDTNVTGTLNLLEEAVNGGAAGVRAFIFSSTTSAFGHALVPPHGEPAAWITEDVVPVPKNIYGVSKIAAENLCELFHRKRGLACLILRISRFFPEEDDNAEMRAAYEDANAKVNEFLFRRVDIEDVVSAHLAALVRADVIGFDRFIISATTPFQRSDLAELRRDAPGVIKRLFPEAHVQYGQRGWRMFPKLDRVYDNARARTALGWAPIYDFTHVFDRLRQTGRVGSQLAQHVGSKGYHAQAFTEGPYPVDEERRPVSGR